MEIVVHQQQEVPDKGFFLNTKKLQVELESPIDCHILKDANFVLSIRPSSSERAVAAVVAIIR